MIKDKILVIDDEAGIRSSLKGVLEDEGYTVRTTDTGKDALDMLREENFDLIFLDIWLPEMNGIEVLEKIKAEEENPQVVMITGHGSVETAVRATRLGAYDFLEKPLSLEKVVLTAQNALRQKNLEEENIQLRKKIEAKYRLIGKSPSIQKLRALIKTAAPSEGRVIIYGENGTGKELIAHMIHQKSLRKNKKFVQINFAAIPEDMIEGELFGYAKGDFPKVEKDKKGKLLLADGGSLFLDEIGEMPLGTQDKLVKFIKEKKLEPLGSSKSIYADTRLIASTTKNLRELISKEKFKKDLFFLLNVIPLLSPPLRDRKEDIPLLINYFIKYFSVEYGKKPKTMSQEAMQAFINYSWPGNVNELMNVIERFVIMIKEEEIKASHLSLLVEPRESQISIGLNKDRSLHQATEQFEREYIHNVIVKHNWDLEKAASALNIEKDLIHEKIKSLGISFLGYIKYDLPLSTQKKSPNRRDPFIFLSWFLTTKTTTQTKQVKNV